jgi:hypothetical protein
MKRRWKILIVVAVLLGVGMLLAMVRHYQLRAATDAYIAQLKAEGEPLDLAQVIPPPVPPDQNGADTFRRAAALMKTNENWWGTNYVGGMMMVAPGKAMVLWQQSEVRDSIVTNSWQNIGAALAQDEKSLVLLQRISGKPDFDFQINYNAGFADLGITNLYLMESKRAAQLLSETVIYDLHNGDTASAMGNMQALLTIIQALRDERLVISELVRIAMAQIAVSANWELLRATNLTDEQLTELQTNWMNLDFIQSDENALAMEQAHQQITVKEWRSSNSGLEHFFAINERNALGLSADQTLLDKVDTEPEFFMWRYWWSYPDELCSLKAYQVLIDTMRSVQTNGSFQDEIQTENNKLDNLDPAKLGGIFDRFFPDGPDLHMMLSMDATTWGGVARRVMAAEVAKRTVITAIALKRYQLKHGNYPPDLNSLVSEFVPAVPLDPVDGQPLRYRLKADGMFLLYSIGPNGKDDGGNPALEKYVESSSFYWLNPHALDWVWPQPATPEEIKNFYTHPK